MNREAAVDAIAAELERAPSVEGAFLSGSLVDRHLDDFSDVDLGVASRDDAEAFGGAFDLRQRLLAVAGRPVDRLERGWGHCRMVAALYGKAEYPPIGLEIEADVLRHLTSFPFHVHDAIKACRRGDGFQVQSMLEAMRTMVFFAAATRRGERVLGAKRAHRHLSQAERAVLEASYLRSDEDVVARLARLYLGILAGLEPAIGVAGEVERLRSAMRELL